MNPGKELDALIAEKVMGCKNVKNAGSSYMSCGCDNHEHGIYDDLGNSHIYSLKEYSTDISAAWEVVEKMYSNGFSYCIERGRESSGPTVWFVPQAGPIQQFQVVQDLLNKFGYTACEHYGVAGAICMAALKAVGEIK